MQSQNTNKSHFDYSQLALVFACAVLLIGITFFKSGFKFTLSPTKSATADSNKVLTYDEVKKQVEEKNQNSLNEALASIGEDEQEQLALLDPSSSGQVLGADTDTENLFPKAETLFSPEVLEQIKINLISENGREAVRKYADSVLAVEAKFGSLNILADLNSSDLEVLKNVNRQAKILVENLVKVPVPSELSEVHRLRMVYYITLGNIALNLAGEKADTDADSSVTLMFSLIERIENLKAKVFEQYQIEI